MTLSQFVNTLQEKTSDTANTHKIIIVKSSMEIRMSQLKMKKYRCKLIDRWEGEEL